MFRFFALVTMGFLKAQLFVNQDDLDPPFRERFFGDRPYIAESLRAFAVSASGGCGARGFEFVAYSIYGCRIALDATDGAGNVGDYFISAR